MNATASLVDELLQRFPIRNTAWAWVPDRNCFITEASDCGSLDPWNRRFVCENYRHGQYDTEGELTHWVTQTTVDGLKVSLMIFND